MKFHYLYPNHTVSRILMITLLFIITLVALSSCKSEPEKAISKQAIRVALIDSTLTAVRKQLLQTQIDSVFAQTKFNGSISVNQNGTLLVEKFAGFEDFAKKTSIDSNSVFAIASISKQFTAAMILLLEEEQKLSTKDLVSKYLPEFHKSPYQQIIIEQLLNHTSGISDFGTGLLSAPGAEFHYSNKGYRFVGEIIEKASGKSFDENAQSIFTKAGMKNTKTATAFQTQHFASAYLGNTGHAQEVSNMPERLAQPEISIPAGGILSTVADLHRWNHALHSGKVISASSLKKMTANSATRNHQVFGTMGYGLGIMINPGEPHAYFHSGYVKGAPSLSIYYPQSGTSVLILSNVADERKGKNAVFNPHKGIKATADAIEITVNTVHKQMLSPETH